MGLQSYEAKFQIHVDTTAQNGVNVPVATYSQQWKNFPAHKIAYIKFPGLQNQT